MAGRALQSTIEIAGTLSPSLQEGMGLGFARLEESRE